MSKTNAPRKRTQKHLTIVHAEPLSLDSDGYVDLVDTLTRLAAQKLDAGLPIDVAVQQSVDIAKNGKRLAELDGYDILHSDINEQLKELSAA